MLHVCGMHGCVYAVVWCSMTTFHTPQKLCLIVSLMILIERSALTLVTKSACAINALVNVPACTEYACVRACARACARVCVYLQFHQYMMKDLRMCICPLSWAQNKVCMCMIIHMFVHAPMLICKSIISTSIWTEIP